MKDILVTTDPSEESIVSLHVAIGLIKQHKSKIYLLHAIGLPIRLMTESQASVPETMYPLNLAEQRFADLHRELETGVEIIDLVETSPLPKAIGEIVKKFNIDLVFMDSDGAFGTKELFIGSNAEKVIRSVTIPILVIRNPYERLKIKHVMLGRGFSERFLEPFEKTVAFAKLFNAKISLVYVNTPYQFLTTHEINHRTKGFLSEANHTHQHSETHAHNNIRVGTGVLSYAEKNKIDLIYMFPNRRKGVTHFFSGSISSSLVNHSDTPVLTIKLEK